MSDEVDAQEQRERDEDAMKLGGMAIEVAVYQAMTALGMPQSAPESQKRALRNLYRAGAAAGFDIAKRFL